MWMPCFLRSRSALKAAAVVSSSALGASTASCATPLKSRRQEVRCQMQVQTQDGSSPQVAFPSLRKDSCTKYLRISYTSTMMGSEISAQTTLEKIAAKSVYQNIQRNVSGHMCYDGKLQTVWQVLEGRPEVVQELWERISRDSRHVVAEDSILIEHTQSRRYPVGWGLRYLLFNDDGGQGIAREDFSEADGSPHFRADGSEEVKSEDLIQLRYKSYLTDTGGDERRVVETIVPAAIVKNARLGVTGWMLYNNRTMTVYQVLEGPRDAVERLWTAIRHDIRHVIEMDSVRRRVIEQREFSNWSMAMDEVRDLKTSNQFSWDREPENANTSN